ncbi:inositol monophosphatase family protein [Bradyrhizobium sp. CB1717]|uniref:inositol monophosphatase family protein n=1 Tax=Bradyrhizobium sp. CB1717 TaxID=3039154 RepID=UPI0024B18F41|nr:inositol monophosphatase family protein [Bradyrhizobium sp. CB1717]WFU25160.1 inositol monophosphatase family protein [Bradyrhizobium sp. CB1717]
MSSASVNLVPYLEFALAISHEAGATLLRMRERAHFDVCSKGGFELVTTADIEVDQLLRARIGERWPDHMILSEEGAAFASAGSDPCWIIDPLDGTANFAHGLDHVAISIALSLGGDIVLGVVHAPFQSQTFHATLGGGAFRDGAPIKISSAVDPARALIATGFPHDRRNIERILDRLKPLLLMFGDIRRLAAPALDICWVADGRLEGFFDRIRIWDVAAAGLIATEAGAKMARLTLHGGQDASDGEDFLIACPPIFDRLRSVLETGRAG